jgi:hypothetical protein
MCTLIHREAATGWPEGTEKIVEIERGSTRLSSLKNSLWKRLQTCRKTDYMMMITIMMMKCTKTSNSKNWLKQS